MSQESEHEDQEPQQDSGRVKKLAMYFESPALTQAPEKSAQKEIRVDSHKSALESFSKENVDAENLEKALTNEPEKPPQKLSRAHSFKKVLNKISMKSKGNADTVIPERALTHESEKPPQKESSVDSHKSDQEMFSNQSKGNEDAVILERDFLKVQRYKVDVTLNADTAHPRLEVNEDGKSVKDTGEIRQVPSKEERFDSNIFVLAKEGYTSGKHYWEVDVGKRRNWILGVASESVARKGTLTLSPKNGFWVIGLADGQEYWAYTDPRTCLTVGGRPQKIGIFLDITANKLSFYNVNKKKDMYIFTTIGDSRQGTKLVPLFSTGSGGVSVLDSEPLKIVQGFDDD